jgi:membrane-associated protease RseP (regulator of RpoE activity)
MESLTPFLLWWRRIVVRDREIVDAVVKPEALEDPAFQQLLDEWTGAQYWSHEHGGRLVLIRALEPPRRERWWLHGLLFALTFVTVWMGGALLAGSDAAVLGSPLSLRLDGAGEMLAELAKDLWTLRPGLDFAMALMAILLAHETGHYLVARRYAIDASPPYFLPAPPFMNFVGTFGAFIRLRSPIVDRRQLLDVGAAGPWAGFVVAMLALVFGLMRSDVAIAVAGPSKQLVTVAGMQLFIGDSPLLVWMREWYFGDATVLLHPLAFAGWIGLLVTMLNLLPLGQLDGGHIVYALIGRYQRVVGILVWVGLIVLGTAPGQWWWWLWAVVILLMGRGRLAHPQVLDPKRPLPRSRWPYGLAAVVLFLVTFTPIPVHPPF